ncbi:ankyrin repeat-containing domain protein [Aspergillus sergii]|uniref:Ankyrin repeat-containing domain protein n=1 Tax=Aspergillus sergii TaxID=1034303 RepID=A0A5N6X9R1_9EURO|nr:ankyrin repeat-containing domain protein [Aspergillus sergii]
MHQLDHSPLEVLLLITSYLAFQGDINSLVQSNRTLYHTLRGTLYKHNVQHNHSSAHYALLLAVRGRHFTTLKTLLSEPRPDQACTATQLRVVLHWAIRSHKEQYVELLLDHDAPLDPAGNGGQDLSALGVAVEACYEAIIPRLLELGAEPGRCGIPGPVERALRIGKRGIAEFLLEYGVRQTSDFGLIYAAEQNDNALLQLLAANGADIRTYGHAALFHAIVSGQCEMVETLIDRGANPHLTFGTIGFAVWFHHLHILKLLLARGVQPEYDDLGVARERGFEEAVTILLPALTNASEEQKEYVADYVTRQRSARERASEIVLKVSSHLADPDLVDEDGNYALQ